MKAPKILRVVVAMVFFEITMAGVNCCLQSVSGAQVEDLVFSADSKTLYGTGENFASLTDRHGMIWAWDTKTGRLRWKSRVEYLKSPAALSPDGNTLLLNDSWQAEPVLWDTTTGKLRCKLQLDPEENYWSETCFTSDSKYILGECERGIQVWDARTGLRKSFCRIPIGKSDWLHDFQFSADGKKALVGIGGSTPTFQLWDTLHGRLLKDFKAAKSLSALAPSGNKIAVAKVRYSSSFGVFICRVLLRGVNDDSLRIQSPEFPPSFQLKSLKFVSENTLLCHVEKEERSREFLWDIRKNQLIEQSAGGIDFSAMFSPDKQLKPAINYGAYKKRPPLVTLYDVKTGAKLRDLEGLAGR